MNPFGASLAASLILFFVQPAAAQMDPDVQRGLVLVKANCAQCHAIGKHGPSPLSEAPPFRDLHKAYPVENLAEAFAEGIVTGHPTMPQFQFDLDQSRQPDRLSEILGVARDRQPTFARRPGIGPTISGRLA